MMMPPFPRSAFELIQSQDLLGVFMESFDRPPEVGVSHYLLYTPLIYTPAQPRPQLVLSIF